MRPPEIRPPRRARTAAVTAGSLLLVLLLASCGPLASPSATGQPVPVGSSSHTNS